MKYVINYVSSSSTRDIGESTRASNVIAANLFNRIKNVSRFGELLNSWYATWYSHYARTGRWDFCSAGGKCTELMVKVADLGVFGERLPGKERVLRVILEQIYPWTREVYPGPTADTWHKLPQ
ncbi:hypothetical protein HZH68_005557 [Vespula germanica]|uniref:Uncharacterized protein n=2 Tax=Vespula TaxID=7451 RepID=A0A834NG47_VESGE|nr:hypothetical protein HZH68_005557 [Vespula germanica]KAF7429705.1 hypothetical protein H0235_006103 [Vespula pensylvanica]